jgi:TPR repeat protein
VPKNDEEAARWFRLAIAQEYVPASVNLRRMHDSRSGVEINDERALEWFELVASTHDFTDGLRDGTYQEAAL